MTRDAAMSFHRDCSRHCGRRRDTLSESFWIASIQAILSNHLPFVLLNYQNETSLELDFPAAILLCCYAEVCCQLMLCRTYKTAGAGCPVTTSADLEPSHRSVPLLL